MTTTTKKASGEKQVEKPALVKVTQRFSFPKDGLVIDAVNLEEAKAIRAAKLGIKEDAPLEGKKVKKKCEPCSI